MASTASADNIGQVLAHLREATRRLVRGVDGCTPEHLRMPSALPGWTRAHVVAHLALNAESLAGVLSIAADGDEVAMYSSSERRDADIEELAAGPAEDLRARLLASTTRFDETARMVESAPRAEQIWTRTFTRTPGSLPALPLWFVPGMREREVEIHHVDLDLGYSCQEWTPAFAVRLVEAMLERSARPDLVLHATDVDRTWQGGGSPEGATVVRGPAADLGWWLSGRGETESLTSERGALPRIEEW